MHSSFELSILYLHNSPPNIQCFILTILSPTYIFTHYTTTQPSCTSFLTTYLVHYINTPIIAHQLFLTIKPNINIFFNFSISGIFYLNNPRFEPMHYILINFTFTLPLSLSSKPINQGTILSSRYDAGLELIDTKRPDKHCCYCLRYKLNHTICLISINPRTK